MKRFVIDSSSFYTSYSQFILLVLFGFTRVLLVNNSVDGCAPKVVYDSSKDPTWSTIDEAHPLDVLGFVEGRLVQDEASGKIREAEGRKNAVL